MTESMTEFSRRVLVPIECWSRAQEFLELLQKLSVSLHGAPLTTALQSGRR